MYVLQTEDKKKTDFKNWTNKQISIEGLTLGAAGAELLRRDPLPPAGACEGVGISDVRRACKCGGTTRTTQTTQTCRPPPPRGTRAAGAPFGTVGAKKRDSGAGSRWNCVLVASETQTKYFLDC